MSDDPASSAAAAAAAAVVAAANPLPDLATMLTEPLRKPQVPLPLPLNPVDDMEASSIQALARLRDSPQRPIAPPSPNRTPRRGARGLFQAAGAGAGGAGGGAGSAPGTPAGGSRRRRTRTQPSKGAHIMTFFEKDINLAAITESTTLYSACRSWMASDATGEVLRSGRAQIDTGRTLQLPPPTEVPLNKRYKPTLPPVPPLEETTKRIDEYLSRNDEVIPGKRFELPSQVTQDMVDHWKEVRRRDNRAWIEANQERYKASIDVILSNLARRQ